MFNAKLFATARAALAVWNQSERPAMRIAFPPTLRIAAGLLLAALLSIVGYQVFRRWIAHGPEVLLERADASLWHKNRPDSPQTKTNIETARLFKRFALGTVHLLRDREFSHSTPFLCVQSRKRVHVLVRFVAEHLFLCATDDRVGMNERSHAHD